MLCCIDRCVKYLEQLNEKRSLSAEMSSFPSLLEVPKFETIVKGLTSAISSTFHLYRFQSFSLIVLLLLLLVY